MTAGSPPRAPNGDGMLRAISREVVAIYKTQLGRGPTVARTDWAGPNALLVTVERTLTPAEQTLVGLGEHARLRDTRMLVQYSAEAEFRAVVERRSGRRVRAFVSGIDTNEDIAAELFYLAPPNSGDA